MIRPSRCCRRRLHHLLSRPTASSRTAILSGPKDVFKTTLQTSKNINDYSDRTLLQCFERTEALQGKGTISIDEIRILLSYVYQRLPPEREVGLFTRYCDLYSRGPMLPGEGAEGGILIRVDRELFMRVVAQVRRDIEESDTFKKIANVKEVAHEFSSHEHLQEHAHKHLRSKYNPQGQTTATGSRDQQSVCATVLPQAWS